jgi:hypothetical protein
MKDWIPGVIVQLVLLCQKWLAALTSAETRAAFHWDDALCAGAVAEIEPFEHAAAACDKDDSTKNRAARRETRRTAIEAMRAFAASSIRNNPYMSEADRLELGLNRPDSIPTVHERPTLRPTAAVERTINFCEHRVKALNPENGKPVKPAGVYGVRFVWQPGSPSSTESSAAGRCLPWPTTKQSAAKPHTTPRATKTPKAKPGRGAP